MSRLAGLVWTILFAAVTVSQVGCMLAGNLMHAAGLDMIPAEYEGMEDAVVALVVLTPSALHENDPAASELTRHLRQELTGGVDDIQLVRDDRVAQWWDTHGYDSEDYAAMGRDIDADRVMVVHLDSLKLKDGATLYRGSADVMMEIIDVETGHVAFSKTIEEYRFPKMAGQHTSETTLRRFRSLYLKMLAAEIGRTFRPFDAHERIALDSTIASQS